MSTVLIDGHYLLHRCLHSNQGTLTTKANKPSGGCFGFIKSLRGTVQSWPEASRIVVVFDKGRSTRRKELYPEYKANRSVKIETDQNGHTYREKLNTSISQLRFVLPRLGVKVISLPGREGDDIIGMLSRELDEHLILVASDDKDMFQLVSNRVQLWRPMREEHVTLDNFEVFAGCRREHWLLRKACLGDDSDNIKGISGVGPKTIDDILAGCGDKVGDYPFDNFFFYAQEHGSKRIRKVADNVDIVLRNYELIDLTKEEFSKEEINSALGIISDPNPFDVLAVKRIFLGLEFFSLIEDFPNWVTKFQILR